MRKNIDYFSGFNFLGKTSPKNTLYLLGTRRCGSLRGPFSSSCGDLQPKLVPFLATKSTFSATPPPPVFNSERGRDLLFFSAFSSNHRTTGGSTSIMEHKQRTEILLSYIGIFQKFISFFKKFCLPIFLNFFLN